MQNTRTPLVQFGALDGWRGISALMVALFHFTALGHAYEIPLIRHAYLFVDFFFVLSGFVITHVTLNAPAATFSLSGFITRRVARIYPLHIVMLLLFVLAEALNLVLTMAAGFKTGNPPFAIDGYRPLATIPEHIFLLQSINVWDRLTWNFPSWSISAECWTYLVFGTICLLGRRQLTVGLAAVGLAGAAMVALYSRDGIETTFQLGFFRCLYGFTTGHLVYRLYRSAPMPTSGWLEIPCLAAVIGFVSYAATGPVSLLAPVMFGAAVYVFSLERGPVSWLLTTPVVQRLGQLSYSIYMVHAFIFTLLMTAALVAQKMLHRPLLVDLVTDGVTNRVIGNLPAIAIDGLMIVYIAAVIAMSRLTWRYIEMPGQRMILAVANSARSGTIAATTPKPEASV